MIVSEPGPEQATGPGKSPLEEEETLSRPFGLWGMGKGGEEGQRGKEITSNAKATQPSENVTLLHVTLAADGSVFMLPAAEVHEASRRIGSAPLCQA